MSRIRRNGLIRFLEQYRTSHPDFVYELQRYSRAMELLDNYSGTATCCFWTSVCRT